jgi:hypothetical protein
VGSGSGEGGGREVNLPEMVGREVQDLEDISKRGWMSNGTGDMYDGADLFG